MATMFVLTPSLLRHLGAEAYGVWLLLFGICNYFNLSSFGFGQTFTLELIKNRERQKMVNKLVNTFLFSLLLFALGTFPIFLLIQFKLLGSTIKISESLLPEASRSFWIIYLVFFLNFIAQLPYNILFARHKLSLRNGIEMGRVALNFVVTLLVLRWGGGLQRLSVATLLVTATYLLVLFFASGRAMPYRIHFSFYSNKLFRKFLRPSFHFFLLGLAMQIIMMSDSILVSALQQPALVAVYTIALRIPDVSMRLIFKITDVKVPKITTLYAAKEWFKLWLLHNRLLWLSLGASGGVAAMLLLVGPWIIALWMGPDFPLNYTLLLIFCLNMFTQCILHVPAVFMQSIGMHERASIVAVVAAPISILMAWWLNAHLGLVGIALGMCSVQFIAGMLIVPQFYTAMVQWVRSSNHNLSLLRIK